MIHFIRARIVPATDTQKNRKNIFISALARAYFIFAVARRGHGQDTEVILRHLMSLRRAGGRESPLKGRDLFSIE